VKRRRAIGAIVVIGAAPAIVRARAVAPAGTLPPSDPPKQAIYDLDHPPWLAPGKRPATRRVWAVAVAEYLAAVGAAVGLDSARQRIATLADERWSSAQAERVLNTVRLDHPFLEIEVCIYRSAGARCVALRYRPGSSSPLSLRPPDDVSYSAVFRDATAHSGRRLIDRLTWLAGLEAREDRIQDVLSQLVPPADRAGGGT
jgi:hypothetical protein